MPNWVANKLYIHGSKTDIAAFKKRAAGPIRKLPAVTGHQKNRESQEPPPPLSFMRFVPVKSNGNDRRRSVALTKQNCMFTAGPLYFATDRLWGTKWDACEADLVVDKENRLRYLFGTAWDAPLKWIKTVSKMYPGLTFSLHWFGSGFYGRGFYKNGKVKENEWEYVPR